jgi:hypothetical protein
MRNLLSFILLLVQVNEIGTRTHNKTQPDPRPTQYTLTTLPTWCTNKVKVTTQPRICPNISNPKLQLRVLITVPVKATDNTHHQSGSLHYNPKFTSCCCTSTPQTLSPIMMKLPVHGTRSRTGSLKKKNDTATAADDLQKLVDREKSKMREDKKKKRAEEKKAKEEKKKKSDQEKAAANSVSISPPSTNNAPVDLDEDMSLDIDEETTTETDDWTEAEDDEFLQGMASAPITFSEKKKQKRQLRQMKHKQSTLLPSRTPQ